MGSLDIVTLLSVVLGHRLSMTKFKVLKKSINFEHVVFSPGNI